MRLSTAIILLAMVSGITVLLLLGFWQLDRLTWKENLIARVEANLSSDAASINDALTSAKNDDEFGIDYRPVKLSGEFVDAKPIFEFTTFGGKSGWNVYSLFKLVSSNSQSLKPYTVINRGFIEFDKKDSFEQSNKPASSVEIVGLLRSTPIEQPSAAFDNETSKRIFYWREINAMAKIWDKANETEVNWYVDAGIPNAKYDRDTSPRPGTTLISFPNSHLQYAFTWFGLAFALLGVGGYFLYSRRTLTGK